MATREYNFPSGPQTDTLPAAGAPTASDDFISKGYAETNYGGETYNVQGSVASPVAITTSGIIPTAGARRQLMFIQGSGGAVDISANPQIAAGSIVGQVLVLYGCSNTNTVTIEDGTGVGSNGTIVLALDWMAEFLWNGAKWNLKSLSERT